MIYGRYIREYNDVSEIARMFLTDYLKVYVVLTI